MALNRAQIAYLLTQYYSSGGGGTPSTAPLFRANGNLSPSIVYLWASQITDATYSFLRSSTSDIGDSQEVYSGSQNTFEDTGLVSGNTYYYWCKVSVNGIDSSYATDSAATLSFTPVSLIESAGMKYNVNNAYADTTNFAVNTIKSILGSGDWIGNGTKPILEFINPNGVNISYYPHPVIRPNVQYAQLASSFGITGDCTIMMEIYTLTAGTEAIMSIPSVTTDYIWINTTNTSLQTSRANVAKTLSFSALNINKPYKIAIRITNTAIEAFIDNMGTPVASSTVTSALTWLFQRLFANHAGSNALQTRVIRMAWVDSSLTENQMNEFFNRIKRPSYSSPSLNAVTPTISGSWTSPVNGSAGNVVSINDNGSTARKKVWSVGNITYALLTTSNLSPTYSDQYVVPIDWSTNKIGSAILLSHYVDDTDIHNHGSIYVKPNRVIVVQHNTHTAVFPENYGNKLKIRSSLEGFDLTTFSELPFYKGISDVCLTELGYDSVTNVNGYDVMLSQGWTAPSMYMVVSRSNDDTNFFEKINVIKADTTNWSYPYLIPNGTINEFFFIVQELTSGSNIYEYFCLLRTTDFRTFYNWQKTYSFTPYDDGPLALATLKTNAVVKDVSGGTIKNSPIGNAYVDENGMFYCICGDGENTGWVLIQADDLASFEEIALVYDHTILTDPSTGSNFNRIHPLIFHQGNGVFMSLALEDNGGNYKVAKFTGTYSGGGTLNLSFVEYVSSVDTEKHWHLQPDANYHFNDVAAVMGTKVNNAGTSATDWYYKVK